MIRHLTLLLLAVTAACALSGCAVGTRDYSAEAYKRTDLTFTGIPTVFGVGTLGTTVPLTPELSLTAAHVAKFSLSRTVAVHPDCDIAVIRHKNSPSELAKFRNSSIGEQVQTFGYSYFSAMPVQSEGIALLNTHLVNVWNTQRCVVTASTAGVVQGMSGGAVYNRSDSTLAGIIEGYSSSIKTKDGTVLARDVSLYIPYASFKPWLDEVLARESKRESKRQPTQG